MTKTIFGKKLLLIATITVLVTGLTLSATFNDAEAKEPKEPKTRDLKCKDNVGSFVSLTTAGPFISTGQAKCKSLGNAAFTTVTEFSAVASATCIELEGAALADPDGYGISKKGFFTFDVDTLTQCFLAKDGITPVDVGTPFCAGDPDNIWFSTVTGSFTITGGLIKGNIPTGDGMLSSAVDHCAGGTAPNGDSAITTLTGSITY
jgi:hypothetical protein